MTDKLPRLPTNLRIGSTPKTQAVVFPAGNHPEPIRADCRTVADDDTDAAFAAEIVRRWNAHAGLVDALRPLAALADEMDRLNVRDGSRIWLGENAQLTAAEARAARAALATPEPTP